MFVWPLAAVKWNEVELNELTIGAEVSQCLLEQQQQCLYIIGFIYMCKDEKFQGRCGQAWKVPQGLQK